MVECPICQKQVSEARINQHLDTDCGREKQKALTPPSSSNGYELNQVKFNEEERPAKRQKNTALMEARPLAERVRPLKLDDFVGQNELVGRDGVLRKLLEMDKCPSMILWGPSGTGKTTLARLVAKSTRSRFVEMSATAVGTGECKKLFEEARNGLKLLGQRTILFLDEIHRFAKNQQDIFLPYVESGLICLIGATTENPSFKVNNALLSRCRVFILKKLTEHEVAEILRRVGIEGVSEDMLTYMAQISDGDARIALNILEVAEQLSDKLGDEEVKQAVRRTHFAYDTHGDAHYDAISALHKSIRGSDPDAALFYATRMMESGEDPLYICRRLIRAASEDIGTADSSMLTLATSTYTAVQQVGMPEADCMIAHCVVALAEAPKSVRVYRAMKCVKSLLHQDHKAAGAAIPIHLRNAPTTLMKKIGYGKEYKYPPDDDSHQDYLPEGLIGTRFLDPGEIEFDESLGKD